MFERIRTLLEVIRFSHTIFALPFALLSAIVAWSLPESPFRPRQLLGIVLCMVFARSAAMAFNRLVDRDVDADNPRTASRHLPAGRIAVRGELAATPVLLGAVVFFWVGGFDIIYACQDFEFDKSRGLHSLPARLGIAASLRIAAVSHLLAICCLFALWYVGGFGTVFLIGVVLVAGLLFWEHSLVRPDDLDRVNTAFFNANALISAGLLIAGAVDVWLRQAAV